MKILAALISVGSVSMTGAFHAPPQTSTRTIATHESNSQTLLLSRQVHNDESIASTKPDLTQKRREFLQSLSTAILVSTASIASFPSHSIADDDYLYKRGEGGDLTSQLFNEDGSLRDPNMVVEAQEKALTLPFSIPTSPNGDIAIATDGVLSSSSANDAAAAGTNLKATYKLPLKWNQDAASQLPLYYDSSEGKNGRSCNRITVYSVSSPNKLDMSTLEKASRVGVAKSLFMDQIPNKYFDQGVLKADLISGRTVRKPIKSLEEEGEIDEQVYYEFDLAFAPLECPDFTQGNKENLGLGFCPYDNIYLVSATVVKNSEKDNNGTLMCCVVECNKDEWKIANSDLKRVRSSFVVDRS